MILDAMRDIEAEGASFVECHPDLEVFRLRFGKAINFEYNEDSQTVGFNTSHLVSTDFFPRAYSNAAIQEKVVKVASITRRDPLSYSIGGAALDIERGSPRRLLYFA